MDPYSSILIASCTDKVVSIFEAFSGNFVCKTSCGEITTSMCLSNNMKHLITASAEGIIYIWKIPEALVRALAKGKQEF